MHFERQKLPFKMHEIIIFSEKKIIKKNMCAYPMPKIFGSVSRKTYFFYLAKIKNLMPDQDKNFDSFSSLSIEQNASSILLNRLEFTLTRPFSMVLHHAFFPSAIPFL